MQGPFTESYLPLGDLWLDFGHGEDVTEYSRELDLDTATVDVSYRAGGVAYRRTLFVSAPDQALVIRLTADQPGRLDLAVSLTTPLRGVTVSEGPDSLRLRDAPPPTWSRTTTTSSRPWSTTTPRARPGCASAPSSAPSLRAAPCRPARPRSQSPGPTW